MKIILKNSNPGEQMICLFSGKPFTTTEATFYDELNRPISHAEARTRNFEFASDFKIPDTIKSREKLSQWLQSIGIKSTTQAYRDVYKKFGENLNPFEVMDIHQGR
jgi:O-methyltransferase involved in polyketide biosynthesis